MDCQCCLSTGCDAMCKRVFFSVLEHGNCAQTFEGFLNFCSLPAGYSLLSILGDMYFGTLNSLILSNCWFKCQ